MEVDKSRRGFLTKVAYTAPLVVTLSVMPSVASAGSSFVSDDGKQAKQSHHRNNNNRWSGW